VLAVVLACGALAGAAEPGMPGTPTAGDSSAAESLGTGRASGDTLGPSRAIAVPRTAADSLALRLDPRLRPKFDQPRWVMLRSLVVPGWGQLYNGSWIKALGVATGEILLAVRMIDDERRLQDLNRQAEEARAANDSDRYNALVEAYNAQLDVTIGRRWWLGGLLTYALLDAYVDAHFKDFDVEFGRDPALPPGAAPTGGRLGVRWRW
jgi:hypothetical protein